METNGLENRPARHRQDRARPAHPGIEGGSLLRAGGLRQPQCARRWRREFPGSRSDARRAQSCDCVSICTPPQAHFDAALAALRGGYHVMLEKPPTATTRQIALLADEAARGGRTLFQTWHSRFAASVDAARDWLRTRELTRRQDHLEGRRAPLASRPAMDFRCGWLRRVRSRHQCAVVAHRDPARRRARAKARCSSFPRTSRRRSRPTCGCAPSGVPIIAEFDFRQKGEQSWDIELTTTTGRLKLSNGGATLVIDGKTARRATRGSRANIRDSTRVSPSCALRASPRSTGGRSSWWPMLF